MHRLQTTRFETRNRSYPSNPEMAYRFSLRLLLPIALLLLADFTGSAQFGSPYPPGGYPGGGGGYPGGGYPGGGGSSIPFPGSRRRNSQNVPTDTVAGKLRRVSSSELVVEPDDGRQISIGIDRGTKYFNTSGSNAKFGDFDPGDQVSIDASRDNQNYYHGIRVNMVKKGSSAEDVSASRTTESGSGKSAPSDDPDRPVLKRAPASGDSTATGSTSTDSTTAKNTPRPQITDGDPVADNRPATTVAPRPVPRESDDPGPPVLRRGAPARVDRTPPAGSESDTVASSRPSIKAEDMNGVTRPPAPPVVGPAANPGDRIPSGSPMSGPRSADPVIQGAREAAASFTETLPNYVVKQFTTRYQTDTAHGERTSWQALDVVTADVVCEGGKESYRNILINGKAPRDAVEKTGSWSTGEFATVLQGILAPQTDADFHGKRPTNIVNRPAFRYDYSVEQPNSAWHVVASAESYDPGYTGSIWIDKENFRVLRIEMSARNMPRSFPLDTVESAVDYDYVLIGDQKFLLPVHSEALSCVRGTSECTRNVIDFRNYRKFGADTSITFDTGDKK